MHFRFAFMAVSIASACAQTSNFSLQPKPSEQPPATITFKDALGLAGKNDPTVLAATTDAAVAQQDYLQARKGLYPSFSGRSEMIYTEGNGKIPTGRYVTQDGVHVYREWAVMHQDLSAGTFTQTGVKRAAAAEALARARVEIARRGLAPTVAKAYYGLIAAQRKYATAQQAVDEAQRALNVTQQLERGGEVAHSDTVKSQLQLNTQQQALNDARLAMDNAHLDLAVLLYRDFNENFSIVDDLDLTAALPPLPDVETMAGRENPALAAAMQGLRAANLDISVARQAYLPSFGADFVYGLEANAILPRSIDRAYLDLGPVPTLGFFMDATLTIPVWDWGIRRSKVRQAELKRDQAAVELSSAQRTLIRNLRGFYDEAQVARQQVELLRRAVDLASESLRLNTLRYQAGEATILELVDAQTALTQARNAYDDGMVRYKLALSNLQTLTGSF
ncbi:MAG TPA: TolC family protein [Bryobacteraceae bacterium]|nr:TolC family protein [Bryobacteraceae bacterium]